MIAELFTFENLAALGTLTALEVVLGIDNIIVISVLTQRLDPKHQAKARFIGIGLALLMRIVLLMGIKWVVGLKAELFSLMGHSVTGKDVVLLLGGMFLITKAVLEIHHSIEGHHADPAKVVKKSFASVVAQIVMLDIVFSLDSVITAVGMTQQIWIMVTAVCISMGIMLAFAGPVSRFVARHPTVKMLAMSFLVLIGVLLVAEGLGEHFPRGYVYFAMAFSLVVELLNLAARRKSARASAGSSH